MSRYSIQYFHCIRSFFRYCLTPRKSYDTQKGREFEFQKIQIFQKIESDSKISKFLNQTLYKTHFIYYIEKRSKKTMSTKMSNMTEKFTVCFTFSFEYFFLFFDTLSFRRDTLSLFTLTHTLTHNPHTHELNFRIWRSNNLMR